MKKIFSLLLVAVCLSMAMPAQAQLRWGVKGGLNLSKASFNKSDFKTDNFTGFFIGPMAEFTIPIIGLGVDGALLLSQKGIKVNKGGGKETEREMGLDIPVNLKYNIGLGSMAGIYFAAGPNFYYNFKKDTESLERKKAQVGINLGAGVKLLRHLQVGINYNIPLSDTATYTVSKESYKTKMWQVSAAYLF